MIEEIIQELLLIENEISEIYSRFDNEEDEAEKTKLMRKIDDLMLKHFDLNEQIEREKKNIKKR